MFAVLLFKGAVPERDSSRAWHTADLGHRAHELFDTFYVDTEPKLRYRGSVRGLGRGSHVAVMLAALMFAVLLFTGTVPERDSSRAWHTAARDF